MKAQNSWKLADFRRHVPQIIAERDELRQRGDEYGALLLKVRAYCRDAHECVTHDAIEDDYERGRKHALDDVYRLLLEAP